jgi:SEC-C motif-containing protein
MMTMLAVLVALVLALHQVGAYAPALRTVCSRRSSSSSSSSRLYMAGFGAKKVDAAAATAPPNPSAPCACGSGAKYSDCCEPFHSGKSVPPTPVKVVRSRFSALVYKLTPYMIATTHASHKEYVDEEQKSKRKIWEKDLKAFADEYDFRSIAFEDEARDSVVAADALQATVAFSAKLQRVGLGERPPEEMKELSVFKVHVLALSFSFSSSLTHPTHFSGTHPARLGCTRTRPSRIRSRICNRWSNQRSGR